MLNINKMMVRNTGHKNRVMYTRKYKILPMMMLLAIWMFTVTLTYLHRHLKQLYLHDEYVVLLHDDGMPD